jgi:A/G-specific adenine glycosylase
LICPIQKFCAAYDRGIQEEIPTPAKKIAQPQVKTIAGLIWKKGTILIHQRPLKGLLGGLWEFPSVRLTKNEKQTALKTFFQKTLGSKIQLHDSLGIYQHIYSHFKERLEIFKGQWLTGEIPPAQCENWKWVSPDKLNEFAFTGICGKVRRDLLNVLHRHDTLRLKLSFPKTNPSVVPKGSPA